MARIKKDLVTQREAEVVEAFKKGASVKEANEAIFTKYGNRMGLKRIYELRAAVKAAETAQATPVVEPAAEAAPTTETPVA